MSKYYFILIVPVKGVNNISREKFQYEPEIEVQDLIPGSNNKFPLEILWTPLTGIIKKHVGIIAIIALDLEIKT